MSKPTIYHNPRCSKSRQTLALLEEKDLTPNIIEYLEHPPSQEELGQLVNQLGVEAHAVLRTKEDAYGEAGLSATSSQAEIFSAIVQYPILLERPIVVHQDKAAIGRPPENVLTLFE
ncbi:MAG: arsenate reductase (glutaredoxin) [Myxococcota bacterium]|nr:arsenate reductase (glutaredoxin) [Myxococcota bacterium]